jgi:hypothetical protein
MVKLHHFDECVSLLSTFSIFLLNIYVVESSVPLSIVFNITGKLIVFSELFITDSTPIETFRTLYEPLLCTLYHLLICYGMTIWFIFFYVLRVPKGFNRPVNYKNLLLLYGSSCEVHIYGHKMITLYIHSTSCLYFMIKIPQPVDISY